jgi:hypothetical protein
VSGPGAGIRGGGYGGGPNNRFNSVGSWHCVVALFGEAGGLMEFVDESERVGQ